MKDAYQNHAAGIESPAINGAEIQPDDTLNLENVTRAIAVGQSGDVRLTSLGGQTFTVFLVAGCPFPLRAVKVWATGTNATNIVGLW